MTAYEKYGFTITRQGWDVLAGLLAGDTLQITKAIVGSGRAPEGTDLAALTDLVAPVALATSTAPIVDGKAASFIVEYRNDMNGGLEEGFWLGEFGLWALDQDGDEVMVYYATLGDYPQYISPYAGGMLDSRRFPVTIALSEGVEVEILYPPAAYVTAEYLTGQMALKEDKSNKIDLSEDATAEQYPSAKSVWDELQAVAATIPAGGLKTPIEWPKESTLPSPANLFVGAYYFIQEMDATAPGHSGRAWVNYTDPADTESDLKWYKVHDQFQTTVAFTAAESRADLVSGSTFETLFGMVGRWLLDLKSAAFKDAGNLVGELPVLGQSLGTAANVPAVTNTSGGLVPHASGALGDAAFKGVGVPGGVPLLDSAGRLPAQQGGAVYLDSGSQGGREVEIDGVESYEDLDGRVLTFISTMDLSGTSMTLNVNNLGAKPVYFFDGVRAFSATAPYTHALLSGQTYQALYSGTAFYLLAQNGGVKAAALAIPTSAWVASTAYSGYPYQATVAVPGVQASGKGSTGSICFDAASYFVASEAGLLSPFVTGNGSITVYAAKVPAAALAGVMTII